MAAKRQYQRPEIKKVKLTPEETVLQVCKTATGTAQSNRRCHQTGNCNNNATGS